MTTPNGWVNVRLDDVAEVRLGRQRSPDKAHGNNLVPYLRAANVRWGGLDLSDVKIMQFSPDEVRTFQLQRDDILVVEASGSQGEVGKSALWKEELPLACLQNTLIRVRSRGADPTFLRWRLHFDAVIGGLGGASKGVGIYHIGAERLSGWPIGLPPLSEQRRIVVKLDAVFDQTRAAKARLERARTLLEKLKRSILASAFRGDLTIDWRAAHPNAEPAPTRSFDAESKAGRLWGSGASTERPLRDLPAQWRWAQVRELGPNSVQIGPMSMKSNEFTDTGTTVLNVGCVQWGRLDLSKRDHLPEKRAIDFERYRVRSGDVLFTRSGTVGRTALATDDVDGALITFHLLRIRAAREICQPGLLYLALRGAPEVRAAIDEVAVGATRAGFNTRLLEDLWIPLPPVEEQKELESRLGAALAAVDEMQSRLAGVGATAIELERALLTKAFRGELVPQDPTDEPASALVDGIRAARAAEPERPRRGRGARRHDVSVMAEVTSNGHATNGHDESLDLVVGVFQIDRRLNVSAIAAASGLDTSTVKRVLKILVDSGQVRVNGRARTASYEWSP